MHYLYTPYLYIYICLERERERELLKMFMIAGGGVLEIICKTGLRYFNLNYLIESKTCFSHIEISNIEF